MTVIRFSNNVSDIRITAKALNVEPLHIGPRHRCRRNEPNNLDVITPDMHTHDPGSQAQATLNTASTPMPTFPLWAAIAITANTKVTRAPAQALYFTDRVLTTRVDSVASITPAFEKSMMRSVQTNIKARACKP